MSPNTILWSYIVLLVAGGMMGLLKAGSKASLFISLLFAAVLSLCAMNIIRGRYAVDFILLALMFVFGIRFAKSLGKQEGIGKIRGLKKDVARMKTIARERQLAQQKAGK